MAVGNDSFEGMLDPVAIRVIDDERRQKLDDVIAVACHLNQDLMILEQRNGDELAEEAGLDRLQAESRRLSA